METRLDKLLRVLKENKTSHFNYAIPDLWMLKDLNINKIKTKTNEYLVNPYDFYISLIEEYILPNRIDNIDYSKSLSKSLKLENTNGDWIKKSILYSMMIRTSTSWDHDRSFTLDLNNLDSLKETGSFVKTLALLPLLKRLGVDVLYLLPISKYSLKDKKGELGSPYGVQSFTELDPLLKDSLTLDKLTVDEEFSALVEACHILGIRVTIDIIPRTNSVCSDLIKEYPEWFYWIKASEFNNYRVPFVESLGTMIYPTKEAMALVYKSEDVIRHIKMFKKNPKETDIELWNTIKETDTIKFIEEIESKFDLKIAPAFSDNINDPQPAWTDVTFFRLFLDDPINSKQYLKIKHNPYILFDTIKSNLHPGKMPNMALWDKLSNIIPYYQEMYGIDGARIDMGHALPKELLKLIMDKAKENDSDFSFIAEELNMDNDKKAKENGYNAMIGNGFWSLPRINEGYAKEFIYKAIEKDIPMFASTETHDTRRTSKRYGSNKLTRFYTIFNYFIPNSIPFINSGQEFYELEPMNLGLDADNSDLDSLSKDDIYYSKLALFDKYSLHYTDANRFEIIDHLVDVLKVREEWKDIITEKNKFVPIHFYNDSNTLYGLSYYNDKSNECLIILGNSDMNNGTYINASLEVLRTKSSNSSTRAKLLYGTYEMPRDFYDFSYNGDLFCFLGSGEVKIIKLEK